MKDYSNYSIQIQTGYEYGSGKDNWRQVWWRIDPSQLSLWERMFKNSWRIFKHYCCDELNPCYSPRRFKDELSGIKTYGQAVQYQKEQQMLVNAYIDRKVKEGKYWPENI